MSMCNARRSEKGAAVGALFLAPALTAQLACAQDILVTEMRIPHASGKKGLEAVMRWLRSPRTRRRGIARSDQFRWWTRLQRVRARRYNTPRGIVIPDLHRFKEIIDRYGHPQAMKFCAPRQTHCKRRCELRTPRFVSAETSSLCYFRKPTPLKLCR
jgi:hypothetical protein